MNPGRKPASATTRAIRRAPFPRSVPSCPQRELSSIHRRPRHAQAISPAISASSPMRVRISLGIKIIADRALQLPHNQYIQDPGGGAGYPYGYPSESQNGKSAKTDLPPHPESLFVAHPLLALRSRVTICSPRFALRATPSRKPLCPDPASAVHVRSTSYELLFPQLESPQRIASCPGVAPALRVIVSQLLRGSCVRSRFFTQLAWIQCATQDGSCAAHSGKVQTSA